MKRMAMIAAAMIAAVAMATEASVVISDSFNTSQGNTYTTSGAIGASDWTLTRSGDDWGGRIDGGILTLTNTASTATNENGWVAVHQSLANSGDFNTVLSNSGGLVSWSFNMRQIRDNPAGFSSGNYGVAFVLGSTSSSFANAGDGYAVVLGNTGTPDPLRLVTFTGGIQSVGTTAGTGLILASSPLNDPADSYMSIMVTYNPTTNLWSMYGRNDVSSFADPLTGTLTAIGTATNDTYTGTALGHTGAYWQGATLADQTAYFDNYTLTAIPEPASMALFGGLGLLLLVARRRLARMHR